jgi:hypothetical protein
MAGGHLRSQIRYHSTKAGAAPDDDGLIASTRTSNALDFALLVQELVPLLDAYERACERNDRENRLALADAICQGISPDPELFLTRLDLLGAYSMIEYLFVATDDEGRPAYTPLGRRHVGLLQEYEARVRRTARALFDDCHHFRPAAGAYSPYGVLYGFSTDLVEHMAFKTLQPDAATHFGLEDVFTAGGADKRGWVIGWRQLPHLPRDVQKQFDYPQPFAEAMFERIAQALRTRAAAGETGPAARTGRLLIEVAGDRAPDSAAMPVADLPVRYIASSDAQLVSANKALACDEPRLASDRREGRSLVSYRTAGGWVAIRKALLTEVLGAGRDVRIGGLPPAAAHVLKLMAPNLVILPEELPHFSPGS